MKLATSLSLVVAFLAAATADSRSQDIVERAYARIAEEVRDSEIEAAWLWTDVYAAEGDDHFSPARVFSFGDREKHSLAEFVARATVKANEKDLFLRENYFAIVIKPKNGAAFGLLRNPRYSPDLFTVVSVELTPKPVIVARLNLWTLVRGEADMKDRVVGIVLPGLSKSPAGEFISSALTESEKK